MPTPPGYFDVSMRLKHSALNRPAFVTFGVDSDLTDGGAVADAVALAYANSASVQGFIDSEVTMNQVRVAAGTDGTEDIITVKNYSHAGIGSASAALPPNCAVLVHKQTARGGRRGKGRLYWPWLVAEGSVDEAGVISGGLVTVLQGGMTTFLSRLVTGGVPMVLFHKPSEPEVEHPTTAGPPNLVNFLQVDPLIATQRRRLGR